MFLFRRMAPAPNRPPSKEPTKGSPDDQFLAEYLIARRTNQRVDKEWEKVHQHRRGKKRFKNMVHRTMLLERLRAMGLNGDGGVGVTDLAGTVKGLGGVPKKVIPKKGRTLTQEEREAAEKRQMEIDRENEKKKGMRERYILENAGSRANSGTSVRKANGKRKLRKFKNSNKKLNKGIEFDEICNFDKTPEELTKEDKMSEPHNDFYTDTDDVETYEICAEEKLNTHQKELFAAKLNGRTIPHVTTEKKVEVIGEKSSVIDVKYKETRVTHLGSKTKDDESKGRKVPRGRPNRTVGEKGSVIRENNFLNDVIKEKENKLNVNESLGVLKSPSVLRSPRVSPINAFPPRSQTLAGVGARGGVMPKLTPVKKRVQSKGVTTTAKDVKSVIRKPPIQKKDDKKGKPHEEKAPRVYVVPAIRM